MNLDLHYDIAIIGATAARDAAEDANVLLIKKKVMAFLCSVQAPSRCTANLGN